MKTIISWLAYTEDFLKADDLNQRYTPKLQGPNGTLHERFYDEIGADVHLILYTRPTDKARCLSLSNALKEEWPSHQIAERCMELDDPTNLDLILVRMQALLMNQKGNEIYLLFQTGTHVIHLAWGLSHFALKQHTHLIQIVPQQYTSHKRYNEVVKLEVEQSSTALALFIREQGEEQRKQEVSVERLSTFQWSKGLLPAKHMAEQIAQTDKTTTLIRGGNGTGKEYIARYIHEQSRRGKEGKPYRAINCSAFTDELLSSELFGHEKGAFTGADKKRKGILEEADGGTVFLDEIGDISAFMQQSLLRVLQEQEIRPVGSNRSKKINVRFITATNKPLEKMIEEDKFRMDLYYRLAIGEIDLPDLKERGKGEIKAFIQFFIEQQAEKLKRTPIQLSERVESILLSHAFPGNVRELQNLIEGFYLKTTDTVYIEHLPLRMKAQQLITDNTPASLPTPHLLRWEDVEKEHIRFVMQHYQGNKTKALKALGYGSINTLKKKLEKYQL
ncbi:sigma-54 dependent transcriptional regulator [Algivirga pacifica]|uniref:Sigma-54 factor interaction domain-containing protein n=1 Tax=Algivirga pacifica TaxID=1162670 RepID=A0ABP9D8R1_9BACT